MGFTVRLLRHLRRRHFLSPLSSAASMSSTPFHSSPPQPPLPHPHFLRGIPTRSFSWSSNSSNNETDLESRVESDLPIMEASGLENPTGGEVVSDTSIWDYPVETVTGFLDGYHDLTGLPWWIVISSSTLAMRFSLFPLLWLQMKKVSRIAQLFPLLPPPFPPPFSGKSWRKQYLVFEKKRKKLGCPSFFWNFSYLTVQLPTFILWMSSIRTMCLNHHPGLETGGALWFQNLIDTPHGVTGCIFPLLIAGLHYSNIQLSFQSVQLDKLRGIYGLMLKYYKLYLDVLSIPFFLVALVIPQGSLVYWTTNGLFTLFQVTHVICIIYIYMVWAVTSNLLSLALRNEHVRKKLGLPDIKSQRAKFTSSSENAAHIMDQEVLQSLSHDQLLDISLEKMTAGKFESSLQFLKVTLEKDPDSVKALVAMSQIMFSKMSFQESIEYVERAISKIPEEDPLLVLALYVAGLSYNNLGNRAAAIDHLKRVPNLNVPEKFMDKTCYYRALVLLGSYLFQEGKASEAIVHLRTAATYDPGVDTFIKECEEAIEKGKASSNEEAIEDTKSVG